MLALCLFLFALGLAAGLVFGRLSAHHELAWQRRQAGQWFVRWKKLRDSDHRAADWWKYNR